MRRRELLVALTLVGSPAVAYAGEDKKNKSGSTSYLAIETLTGATNKPSGRRGVLSVECGLDVPDADLRERAKASLPRLRAAYVQIVMIYAAGLPLGAPPNADFIGRALQRETDGVLGRPGARLLLGAILVN